MEHSIEIACLLVVCGCAYQSIRIGRQHPPKRDRAHYDAAHTDGRAVAMGITWWLPAVGLAISAYQHASSVEYSAGLSAVLYLAITGTANLLNPWQAGAVHFRIVGYVMASCMAFLGYQWSRWMYYGIPFPVTEVVPAVATILGLLWFPAYGDDEKKSERRTMKEMDRSIASWLLYDWGLHPVVDRLPPTLAIGDVPRIADPQSAQGMVEVFQKTDARQPLEWRILSIVKKDMIMQWLLMAGGVGFDFLSSYALYRLLQHMEVTEHVSEQTWIYFSWLPLCYVVKSICESREGWIGQSRIHLAVLGLMQSLVFEKMTRLRVTRSAASDAKKTDAPVSTNDALHTYSGDVAAAYHELHRLPFACFKVILYSVYLSNLLGWKPVAVGSVAAVVSVLLSKSLSARFQKLQAEQNKARSNTSAAVEEALTFLRDIRLWNMGTFWQRRLNEVRDAELSLAWKTKVIEQLMSLTASLGPVLFASVALSYAFISQGSLISAAAFAALKIFSDLHRVLKAMPLHYNALSRWRLGLTKMKAYLEQPEQVSDNFEVSNTIELENADLDWTEQKADKPTLSGARVEIPPNAFTLVTGPVGAGKSLLLSALLGEAFVQSGSFRRPALSEAAAGSGLIAPGSTAYVSNPPWIEDCSVRDNILFGQPTDRRRYHKVLSACALLQDLASMPKRDLTAAGQGGVSLSGGQRWRVALARALYSSAEILVLEDVLSAVDAPIARHICQRALQGELVRGRTVILATHQPKYCLSFSNNVVFVKDGTANAIGNQQAESSAIVDAEDIVAYAAALGQATGPVAAKPAPPEPNAWKVLWAYVDLGGSLWSFIFSILVTIGYRVLAGSTSWWLAEWTSRPAIDSTAESQWHDVAVYMGLTVASTALVSIQALLFTLIGHASSTVLFNRLIEQLFKAKLSWIDATPAGQVIKTLNSDMYAINHRLAPQIIGIASSVVQIVFVCVTSYTSSPYTLYPTILIITLYVWIAQTSLRVSSKLRPHLTTCSFPISNLAVSVQGGLTTIRAFGRTQHYISRMRSCIDDANSVYANIAIGHQWLASRMGFLSAAFVSFVAAGTISSTQSAAATGLAITLALKLKHSLELTIGQINVTRTGTAAVQRVLMLAEVPTEEDETQVKRTPSDWPSEPNVSVSNIVVRHEGASSDALKKVSFEVKAGQRVGIVGRTGAGKTSLVNAIMGFVPIAQGVIMICDEPKPNLKLSDLRKVVRIVPQDSFLFSGTVRQNLDPDGKCSDEKLNAALERVKLKVQKGDNAELLDRVIQTGGLDLSHGQRQLVCLARVLLDDECRVLILDEATSGVDEATDKVVEEVIKTSFENMTVLVIAHRIATVAEFDRIVVLSEGEVVENDSPRNLLKQYGQFAAMVDQSEHAGSLRTLIRGEKMYYNRTSN